MKTREISRVIDGELNDTLLLQCQRLGLHQGHAADEAAWLVERNGKTERPASNGLLSSVETTY